MLQKCKLLSLLSLLMLLGACNNESTETTANTTSEDTTKTVVTPEPEPKAEEPDATTLEGFFKIYQEAFAKKDIETLKSLSDMEMLGDDFYADYLFEEFQDFIAKATVADIKPDEGMGEGYYSLTDLSIPTEEEQEAGAGEGSSFSWIFKKGEDGKFYFAESMAAG
ncbi:MAG: hypothetical protein GY810_28780 [Aureispira sp.]|nr:hypothetical protein [Aureispira sp.]